MNIQRPLFWHQGLFLQPQHFQLQEQSLLSRMIPSWKYQAPHFWGVGKVAFDEAAIATGSFNLHSGSFLFQDGTYVEFPGNALVAPRSLDQALEEGKPLQVYIGMKRWNQHGENVTIVDGKDQPLAAATRYTATAEPEEVCDLHGNGPHGQVRRLNYVLSFFWDTELDRHADYLLIPLARLEHFNGVRLSTDFIPPSLALDSTDTLRRLIHEIRDILSARCHHLEQYKKQRGVHNAEFGSRDMVYLLALMTLSLDVEMELKKGFCTKFHDNFLAAFDRRLAETMTTFSPATSEDLYGEYVVHLARRINLLKAVQRERRFEALQEMPQPAYIPVAAAQAATPELKQKFALGYLSYLTWRDNTTDVARELPFLEGWLGHLLVLKGGNKQWVLSWIERNGTATPVTFAEFWGGSHNGTAEKVVPAAFTRKGKEQIDRLLDEVASALPDARGWNRQRAEFERWYRTATFASWEAFAASFAHGTERLKGEQEWRQAAGKMATDEGPYFSLLKRLACELTVSGEEASLPGWLRKLHQLQGFEAASAAGDSQAVSRAADGGKKLLVSLEKKMGREVGAQKIENELAAGQAYRDYRAALATIVPAVASRTQAYQAAVQLYSDDPAVSKSPFVAAANSARQLKTALAAQSPGEIAARLVDGPVEFMWTFLKKEAAGHLQNQWEEQVLAGTTGLTGQQATPALLGAEGLLWKFVKGPAAPFLCRTVRGYRAKEVSGICVDFDPGFLAFLEKGSQVQAATMIRQPTYSVGIEGLPTDANRDARIKPQATRLELQCGGASQNLANLNYPVGKTFNWSPESCGDVLLQIEVGDQVLTRRYLGQQAFPEFLQLFASGHHTFTPTDFPGERKALERLGIRFIRVNYHFIGSGPVIKQMTSVCGRIPRNIAKCWSD